MKIFKIYEKSHDDLIEVLQDIIKKDNKIINGFDFYQDAMCGAFEWGKKDSYLLEIYTSN